jgi:hypothetical protein
MFAFGYSRGPFRVYWIPSKKFRDSIRLKLAILLVLPFLIVGSIISTTVGIITQYPVYVILFLVAATILLWFFPLPRRGQSHPNRLIYILHIAIVLIPLLTILAASPIGDSWLNHHISLETKPDTAEVSQAPDQFAGRSRAPCQIGC